MNLYYDKLSKSILEELENTNPHIYNLCEDIRVLKEELAVVKDDLQYYKSIYLEKEWIELNL